MQGVSARRVKNIVSRSGFEELSASSVSRISKELEEKVDEFLKRPIEHPVSYLFEDANYLGLENSSASCENFSGCHRY
jgi:transposase-like protein